MFIRSHKTTLIQTFCKHFLNCQVIFKSIRVADDTLYQVLSLSIRAMSTTLNRKLCKDSPKYMKLRPTIFIPLTKKVRFPIDIQSVNDIIKHI